VSSAPFLEPDPFKGVLGPTLAKNRAKTANTNNNDHFPTSVSATKYTVDRMWEVGGDCGKLGHGLVAALWLASTILDFFKDCKLVILGVWAAPGAPETLAKGGGLRPHLSEGSPRPPGPPRPQK
jgi:hypothetical protein